MAQTLKPVGAVVIGIGLSGTIIAKALADAALKVVGRERGEPRDTVPDFQAPEIHDELKYAVRKGLMQNAQKEAVTRRNAARATSYGFGSITPQRNCARCRHLPPRTRLSSSAVAYWQSLAISLSRSNRAPTVTVPVAWVYRPPCRRWLDNTRSIFTPHSMHGKRAPTKTTTAD